MRRVMVLALLALALPTAALANSVQSVTCGPPPCSVDFAMGTFISGTITRTADGGLTSPNFTLTVVGTEDTFVISIPDLTPGCVHVVGFSTACTYSSGTITIKNPSGAVLFTGSLGPGEIFNEDNTGSLGGGPILPKTTFPSEPGGTFVFGVVFNTSPPFNDNILGSSPFGTNNILATLEVPEPGALEGLLLGTGMLGLAEMTRRKLRLGT